MSDVERRGALRRHPHRPNEWVSDANYERALYNTRQDPLQFVFPDRPVFPQDPATFDDRSLVSDIATGGRTAPWIVGSTLLAFAVVLYCILVAEVR